MIRPIAVLTPRPRSPSLAPTAQAAPKSCQREGATLLAASGKVRVVSVKEKPQNSETRRDRIYGCWTSTGRRFTLFQSRDFGLDSIERDHFEIIDGRYIGAIREFEGGVERVAHRRHLRRPEAQGRLQHQAVRRGVVSGDFYGVDRRRVLQERRDRLHVLEAVAHR